MNFNPQGKNDFAHAMTSFSRIFRYFHFTEKSEHFRRIFFTVFVINRIDKFIKVLLAVKF